MGGGKVMKDQYVIEHSPDNGETWNICYIYGSMTPALRHFEKIITKSLDSWRLTVKENW